jgi:hypothetical protein
MLELILGLLSFLVVTVGVRVYLAYFIERGVRHPAFEAWCDRRPLVFALFVPRAELEPTRALAAARLSASARWVNLVAGFPWTHYGIGLRVRELSPCVVGVFISSRRVLRGNELPPRALVAFSEIARATRRDVAEIWLDRDLFTTPEARDGDAEMGWRGHADPSGDLAMSGCTELPFWLRALPTEGPRDGRQKTDDVVAALTADASPA